MEAERKQEIPALNKDVTALEQLSRDVQEVRSQKREAERNLESTRRKIYEVWQSPIRDLLFRDGNVALQPIPVRFTHHDVHAPSSVPVGLRFGVEGLADVDALVIMASEPDKMEVFLRGGGEGFRMDIQSANFPETNFIKGLADLLRGELLPGDF